MRSNVIARSPSAAAAVISTVFYKSSTIDIKAFGVTGSVAKCTTSLIDAGPEYYSKLQTNYQFASRIPSTLIDVDAIVMKN